MVGSTLPFFFLFYLLFVSQQLLPSHKLNQFHRRRLPSLFLVPEILQVVPKTGKYVIGIRPALTRVSR